MGAALILEILSTIRQLSGIANTLRQNAGLTKEQLIAEARKHDQTLATFIDTELAMLDAKQGLGKH